MTYTRLEKEIIDIFERDRPPEAADIIRLTGEANLMFSLEDPEMRPLDESGLPGGIVLLDRDMPSMIVPDIHARQDFLLSVLMNGDETGANALKRMYKNELQIVCLGDGMHSEGRAFERWDGAYQEFLNDYLEHGNMDDEIRESMGVMEMVMRLKIECPQNFHFLKGNHENVANEDENGNHSYMKYALEGDMFASYFERFYGPGFMRSYYQFERNLPLLAVGKNFLASHAEPAGFCRREQIINYRTNPLVVEGLTWTDNGAAEEGSVAFMLSEFLGPYSDSGFYFGGHRPITSLYEKRAGGKFIQIHNPDKFIIVKIDPLRDINVNEDIMEIENSASRIVSEYRG
jgi:hypothetical protein